MTRTIGELSKDELVTWIVRWENMVAMFWWKREPKTAADFKDYTKEETFEEYCSLYEYMQDRFGD